MRSASERRLERAAWIERLQFVLQLEKEGRFREARVILGRVPDGGSGDLRGEIEAAIRDLDIAEKLEGVRVSRGQYNPGGGLDYDESSRQYETIFREAELGSFDEDPLIVGERLKVSSVRKVVLAALDAGRFVRAMGPDYGSSAWRGSWIQIRGAIESEVSNYGATRKN